MQNKKLIWKKRVASSVLSLIIMFSGTSVLALDQDITDIFKNEGLDIKSEINENEQEPLENEQTSSENFTQDEQKPLENEQTSSENLTQDEQKPEDETEMENSLDETEMENSLDEIDKFSIDEQGPDIIVPMPEGIDNLALNAKTLVSSNHVYSLKDDPKYVYSGANAVDGTINTRWWSNSEEANEWIIFDLGEAKNFNRIVLQLTLAEENKFKILISNLIENIEDMSSISDWNEIKSGSEDEESDFWFEQMQNSRYIKLEFAKTDNTDKISVWEFGVYNHQDEYLAKASLSEISSLAIPKYIKSSFDVPISTSFGADVFWESDNEALKIDSTTGKVTITPPSTKITCKLTATVQYKTQPKATVDFSCVIAPVDEELIDYKIYPQPQRITRDGYSTELTDNITLVVKNNAIDSKTQQRAISILSQHGYNVNVSDTPSATDSDIILDIYSPQLYPEFTNSAVSKDEGGAIGEYNIFDAHIIKISQDETSGKCNITIIGKHNDALYYALASIDQILEQVQTGNNLTAVTIEDYSNSKYRGVIEGFYGYPYSTEDIESLMKFGQKYKMNTFVYGPKADPYHAGKWKEPYPTESTITEDEREQGVLTQEEIKDIAKTADECNVDFIWTIHPMMEPSNRIDITDPAKLDQGVQDVIEKYELMYNLGVHSFGMFVDDLDLGAIDVLTYAPKQAELIGKITANWKQKHPDEFKPIFYVPTLYCFASYWPIHHVATNVSPLSKLENIDDIAVSFTGADVFSPIQNDSFFAMAGCIDPERKHKLTLWWNSPVNDGATNSLFMGPANQQYDMYNDVTDSWGMMSNPMCQSEASKVQLFGLIDYSWNIKDFDAEKNWEDSFAAIIGNEGELTRNFKIFAQNSAPAKHQDNTNKPSITYSGIDEAVKALEKNKSIENFEAVLLKLKEWKEACLYLQKNLPNSNNTTYENLYKELEPWLNKSITIVDLLQNCLNIASGKDSSITTLYTAMYLYANMSSDPSFVIQTLGGTGTDVSKGSTIASVGGEVLNEFIPTAYKWACDSIGDKLPQITPYVPKIISNMNTNGITIITDEKKVSLTGLSKKEIKSGDYIGISFESIPPVDNLSNILMSLPKGIQLQYSTGGPIWNEYTLNDNTKPITAVRLFNISDSSISLIQDKLEVLLCPSLFASSVTALVPPYDNHVGQFISDGDWSTFYWTNGDPSNSTIQLDYDEVFPIKNIQFVFSTGDKLSAVTEVEVSEDGKEWKSIGTLNGTKESAVQPQIISKDGENYQFYYIYGIDNTSVSHIRLTIDEQPGGGWLKVHEIIPNGGKTPSIIAESGKNTDSLLDCNFETIYFPDMDIDTITCGIFSPLKINTVDLYMKPNKEGLPKAEVESDGEWKEVPIVLKDGYNYVIDVSNLMNITNLRLSWTEQNRPLALYEIIYQTTELSGNKTELILNYNKALNANKDNYSNSDWENLQKVIADAIVLINKEASQTQIDTMANALKEVYDNVIETTETTTENNNNNNGNSSSSGGGNSSFVAAQTAEKYIEANSKSFITYTTELSVKVDDSGKASTELSLDMISDIIFKAKEKVKDSNNKDNNINIEIKLLTDKKINGIFINISKDAFAKLTDEKSISSLNLVSSQISLKFDSEALSYMKKETNEDIVISSLKAENNKLSTVAESIIGNRPIYDLSISYGNKQITNFGSGTVTVSIPYQIASGELASHLYAVYIDNSGKVNTISDSKYDENSKSVVFNINHLSMYGIGYQNAAFNDINGHWAISYIQYMIQKNIFSGTSETTFSPDSPMTRGMFVTTLGRMSREDILDYNSSSFNDVQSGSYYLPYIEWASNNKIAKGTGNNKFSPESTITREEMATMMANYISYKQYKLDDVNSLILFSDSEQISSWAKDSVETMQKKGVISGNLNNLFNPKGISTRAEVSTLLARFLEIIEAN